MMDMSFAVQSLASEHAVKHDVELGVHTIPAEIDDTVARLKLASLHLTFDTLTPEQEKYLASWKEGT